MPIPQEWLQYAPKPRDLKPGQQWHVFLSYRSVNRTWVLHLYDVLVELGYKVFMDQFVLKLGDSLVAKLNVALKTSQAGILMWSNAAEDSAWVQKEYDTMETMATENPEFCFVPIKLDTNELPPFASTKIFMDFSSYPDGPNGGELIRLLHGIVGKPLDAATVKFAAEQDEASKNAASEIEAARLNKDPEEVLQLFQNGGLPWKTTAALGCKAAEALLKMGKNNDALQVLQTIEEQFPNSIRPKQLHALALARRGNDGDLKAAQKILAKLYADGERDPETLGIYARTWMDRYALSNDAEDLEQSRDLYAEAFAHAPDDYYTGVNVAAKSILLNTTQAMAEGMSYAKQVEELLQKRADARANQKTTIEEDYWEKATVGEVLLMQKKWTDAGDAYKSAVKMARSDKGSHESTWKQACRLMQKLKPSDEEKAQVLSSFSHLPSYDHFNEEG